MSLTDGTYVARIRLNRLDQPYPAGSLVPGSAFRDEAQIIEYIRRHRVDVGSAGDEGGAGGSTPIPNSFVYGTNFSAVSIPGNSSATSLPITDEGDSAGADVSLSGGVFTLNATGLYTVHLDVSWANSATGKRAIQFGGSLINDAAGYFTGTPYFETPSATGFRQVLFHYAIPGASGMTVSALARQNSGSALNVTAVEMTVARVL